VLPAILSEYQRLLDESQGRERAEVTAALDLDEAQRARLGRQLSTLLDKEVVLTARTDEEVIGGVLVRIGDRIIDGSARGRLRSLRQSVLATPS
jgi:F-type H+-transporting ATPase subunit delta